MALLTSWKKSEFRLLKRNFPKTLLLIPGWATDFRVFKNLDLPYNYLITEKLSCLDFNRDLLEALEENKITRVSLFGWSQGGFLAAGFAQQNPQRTEELFLLSVRKRYAQETLRQAREGLEQDKGAFLAKVYADSFSNFDHEARDWFNCNLLEVYLKEMMIEDLLEGLDYLAAAEIKPEFLEKIPKIKIFHGRLDRIAPVSEAEQLKAELNQAGLFIFPKLGHNLFLNPEFAQRFKA